MLRPAALAECGCCAAIVQRGVLAVGCREVNVPMRFPKEKVRGMLQNPVMAELLDRLIERGEKDVADRAHGALLDAAAKKGLLQENGEISCPTNIALFVTARP